MPIKKTKAAAKQQPGSAASVSKDDLQRLKGLAERTKATRTARGYESATEFCIMAGVSKQYLGNIELGRVARPEAMPMIKVARALNVSLDWLLTGEGLPTGDTLKILPKEFDMLRALREASEDDRKVVSIILKPYMQTPGKPSRRSKAER